MCELMLRKIIDGEVVRLRLLAFVFLFGDANACRARGKYESSALGIFVG